MSIESSKLMNLADGKVLYDDLRQRIEQVGGSIIDDTAGVGDTDKTFSADKLATDHSSLLNEIDEHSTELAMLIDKHEIPPEPPTEIVQIIDLTNATHKYYSSSETYEWHNFVFPIEWLGSYYPNPSGMNLSVKAYPYNSSDEHIAVKRNGISGYNSIVSAAGGKIEVVSRREIKTYTNGGSVDWTWTTDEDIAYLTEWSRNDSTIGPTTSESQLLGITYGGESDTYIPYGESESSESETEYEYSYKDAMSQAVKAYFDENFTDDKPTEESTNYVKSGGIVSSLLKDSYNLVEPEWFVWVASSSGYYTLKDELYIPVTPGKYLLSNCGKVNYRFYDSSKTQIGDYIGTSRQYQEVLVPSGSVFMRISINSSDYVPDDHKVVIYYSKNANAPTEDRRGYIEHKNLQGIRGSNEIFDYYAPNAIDKEILQMAKYAAVRSMNFCNNIIRIGTFNMYNPRLTSGWETAKKMFKDYALDVVGFQEVSDNQNRVLTEFLKGWQFTDGATDAPVAVASQFEVLSYNTYTTSETNRKFMKCVLQLPMYADSVNPTLSVYDYHGIWEGGTVAKREQEIQDILAIIANDTSDFIIVVGDTNADAPHTEWDVWRNAGFTPVHDGVGVNTTIDNPPYCLDNIFVGSGITTKSYHVVPARDYMIPSGNSTVPISDHDFVFADVQFDFDSLLET